MSPSHMSPEEKKKIGYNKCSSTPKTPEQLMSNFRLEQEEAHLMQSKSNSGSGHKNRLSPFEAGVTGTGVNGGNGQMKQLAGTAVEIQGHNVHKIGMNQDLEIGQEVLNQQPCSQFPEATSNYNCQESEDNRTSSSIFSSTPFRTGNVVQTNQAYADPNLNFLEHMMDSEDGDDQLKIKKEELSCQPQQHQQSLFTNKFNAMTLFAYRGDGEQDNFASAFSNSRFGEPNNRIDAQFQGSSSNEKSNEGSHGQAIHGLNSQSIWMVPFQQQNFIQK